MKFVFIKNDKFMKKVKENSNINKYLNNVKENCKTVLAFYKGFINNKVEARKTKKALKVPVNLVINSEYVYENRKLNILKECLNVWSEDNKYQYSTLKFDWIYVDPELKEKVYFLSTNMKELKRFQLDDVINKIQSENYMDSYYGRTLYTPSYEREEPERLLNIF